MHNNTIFTARNKFFPFSQNGKISTQFPIFTTQNQQFSTTNFQTTFKRPSHNLHHHVSVNTHIPRHNVCTYRWLHYNGHCVGAFPLDASGPAPSTQSLLLPWAGPYCIRLHTACDVVVSTVSTYDRIVPGGFPSVGENLSGNSAREAFMGAHYCETCLICFMISGLNLKLCIFIWRDHSWWKCGSCALSVEFHECTVLCAVAYKFELCTVRLFT